MDGSNTQPAHESSPADAAAISSAGKYDTAYTDQLDFTAEPNRFLATCLERIAAARTAHAEGSSAAFAPLRALDVGIGQGRNAFLLAQRGFETHGIDRSEVGVRAARQRARDLGLDITIDVSDSTAYDFGINAWDVIVMLYYPQPMLVIEKVKAAIKPGGHLILERFSQPKLAEGPDFEETKKLNPMLQSFADWHVLHYEHDVLTSDWHWRGESPTGPIVRVLARKP